MDDSKYERYLSGRSEPDESGSVNGTSGFAALVADAKEKLGLRRLPPVTLLLLVSLLVAVGAYVWAGSGASKSGAGLVSASKSNEGEASLRDEPEEGEAAESAAGTLFIYVTGAVHKPGVYELPSGSRGIDAIEAAGGLRDNAASEILNLAALVEDGSQLHILTRKEAKEQGSVAGAGSSGIVLSGAATGQRTTGLVNINTADSAALQTLPGIGPVTAEKIIADRERNGAFSSLEDLTRIAGIGPKKVEALEGLAASD